MEYRGDLQPEEQAGAHLKALLAEHERVKTVAKGIVAEMQPVQFGDVLSELARHGIGILTGLETLRYMSGRDLILSPANELLLPPTS